MNTQFKKGTIPWNKGLNGVQTPYWLGKKRPSPSEATRQKMREARAKQVITEKHCQNISDSHLAKKNPIWKGEEATYGAIHAWVRANYGQPNTCEHCQQTNLTGKQIHWANKNHLYKREREDWLRLCVKCHALFDKQKK